LQAGIVATGIEKKLRLRLSFIMIAAIALDRAKLQHARVPVQHRDKTIKRTKEKKIGKIGKDVVRNDERQRLTRT
jgi:hypothetical protein